MLSFTVEALYNKIGHEHTPRGGASDSCRPKLHRWPFSFLYLVLRVIPLEASLSLVEDEQQKRRLQPLPAVRVWMVPARRERSHTVR
jgi:hypothetical protein